MNAIISLNYLMANTELTSKQEDYVKKIKSSARGLLGIINDILDFSKIEAGKLKVENIDFELKDVLANLGNIISHKVRDRGLKLFFEVNTNIPDRLVGDPLRLGQVLLNLTSNAIKFTEEGEIKVKCELVNRYKNRATLKFIVSDSGIGLSKEEQQRLFQPFSQADTSITRMYGGTGLGLSISKGLVKMMGGSMGVFSEPGEGSTFLFTVDCGVRPESIDRRISILPELKGFKVLVVDDSEIAGKLLASFLKDFFLSVKVVTGGQEALDEIERANVNSDEAYRLVFLDWKMPNMNGSDVLKRVKAMANIIMPKFLIVTGYSREQIINESEGAGADGFLFKPIEQAMLLDTITQTFSKPEHRPIHERVEPEKTISPTGGKLLLVEDNEINQQVAVEILEHKGYSVDVAANGEEALEMVQSSSYNLVLMDLQMPVMDGFTATTEIRKLEASAKLPIIAMTADAMSGVEKEVLNIGMNDYITKPIDPDQLFSTIDRWIKFEQREESALLPAKEPPLEKELPRISHLSIAEGITRLGGNVEKYLKLIFKFRKNNLEKIEELERLIKLKDYEQAEREVHTVKGIAGNISANELFKVASQLDRALKEGVSERVEHLFGQFTVSMTELLSSIEEYEREYCREQESHDESEQALDMEELERLRPQFDELLSLLNRNNTRALKLLSALLKGVAPGRVRRELLEVDECLDNYDFERGLELLRGFMSRYYS